MSASAGTSVVDRARDHVVADAAAWGVGPRTAVAIAILPLAVASIVAAARLSRPLSGFLTDEGSVLEWTQVAVLITAAVAFAGCALRLGWARRWVLAGLSATATLVMVVIIGEELSWGQPATNLHLLRDAIRTINVLMIFAAGGLVLMIAAMTLGPPSRRRHLYGLVPPLALIPAFAIPFAYRLVRLITDGGASGPFSEMSELSLYYGIAVFAVLLARRIGGIAAAAP